MVIILLVLILAGFFFPPVWLALIGFGIYVFASRKSRRDDAVENRVKRMVAANRDFAIFPDLYFEAARSYAIAKGAEAAEQDAASARIIVDSTTYSVVFMRSDDGGTAISVETVKNMVRRFESFLPEATRTYR